MADISDKSLQEALEWFDHELRRRLKEAEAMCEWLAYSAAESQGDGGWSKPSGTSVAAWLAAAREAVREDS